MVGDAVAMKRSFVNSIPVIGVNSWGAVANSNDLIDPKEQVHFKQLSDFLAYSNYLIMYNENKDTDTKKRVSCLQLHCYKYICINPFSHGVILYRNRAYAHMLNRVN